MAGAQERGKGDIGDESNSETAHKASAGPLGGIDI